MPHELQIIRASEFIRIDPRGRLDLPGSKAALKQLAHACRKRHIGHAMVDLRDLQYGAKPLYTPRSLADLVSSFEEAGFAQDERLAVLYRIDPFHTAHMFAFLSTMHGWNVRVFDDFEKALFWLSSDTKTPARRVRSAAGKTVPIRQRKTRGARQ